MTLLVFAACGGGGGGSSGDGDAGTCPALVAPPACTPGGLNTIFLAGTWTFTGTQRDDNCLAQPPTETPVNNEITFVLSGCKWDQAGGPLIGSLDETIARKSSMDAGSSLSMEICVVTGGGLRLQTTSTTPCVPANTTPRTITITGTLTR